MNFMSKQSVFIGSLLSNEGDFKTVMLLIDASVGQLMNWSLKVVYESFDKKQHCLDVTFVG